MVVTSIKMPALERKAVCKQVCRGEGGGRRGRGRSNSLGWEPRHFPSSSPRGEAQGWAWAEKELNLIQGTVVWVMHLKFKIEREMFMQLGFLSLYI